MLTHGNLTWNTINYLAPRRRPEQRPRAVHRAAVPLRRSRPGHAAHAVQGRLGGGAAQGRPRPGPRAGVGGTDHQLLRGADDAADDVRAPVVGVRGPELAVARAVRRIAGAGTGRPRLAGPRRTAAPGLRHDRGLARGLHEHPRRHPRAPDRGRGAALLHRRRPAARRGGRAGRRRAGRAAGSRPARVRRATGTGPRTPRRASSTGAGSAPATCCASSDDGWAHVVDRVKDMYISGGENVYPAEVEAVAVQLDAVADCAVVGVPDPRWGEVGVAYVQLREGASADRGRAARPPAGQPRPLQDPQVPGVRRPSCRATPPARSAGSTCADRAADQHPIAEKFSRDVTAAGRSVMTTAARGDPAPTRSQALLPPSLQVERHGDVAVLRLARAAKRNALDDATVLGIEAFFASPPAVGEGRRARRRGRALLRRAGPVRAQRDRHVRRRAALDDVAPRARPDRARPAARRRRPARAR